MYTFCLILTLRDNKLLSSSELMMEATYLIEKPLSCNKFNGDTNHKTCNLKKIQIFGENFLFLDLLLNDRCLIFHVSDD